MQRVLPGISGCADGGMAWRDAAGLQGSDGVCPQATVRKRAGAGGCAASCSEKRRIGLSLLALEENEMKS